eukprot:m.93444 g.93444  ORF g.93444 m.93444 type:complete len:328 (+) comp15094_c0_seq2:191-1174(+)
MRVASCSDDRTARIWDVSTGACEQVLQGHLADVNGVSLSPDNQTVATCSDSAEVWIWNIGNTSPTTVLSGHSHMVLSTSFSPSGELLSSTGGRDHSVRIWNTSTGKPVANLQAQGGWVRNSAWSPSEEYIASVSDDRHYRVYRVGDEVAQRHKQADEEDEDDLLDDIGSTHLPSWRVLHAKEMGATVAATSFSPCNDNLLATVDLQGNLQVLNCETDTTQNHNETETAFWGVTWSPCGTMIAYCGLNDGITILDAETLQTKTTARSHTATVRCVAWEPSGATLATCSDDHAVVLYDARDFSVARQLNGHTSLVRTVCFTPQSALPPK